MQVSADLKGELYLQKQERIPGPRDLKHTRLCVAGQLCEFQGGPVLQCSYINYFSCCCHKIPNKGSLRKVGVCLGSQEDRSVHQRWGGTGTEAWLGNTVSTVRSREVNASSKLAHLPPLPPAPGCFLFLFGLELQSLGCCCPHSRWVSLLS